MTLQTILTAAVATLALASQVQAGQATTLTKMDLYAGPGASFSRLGTVDGGAKVGVIWCGAEVKFCLVQYHNKQGWVAVSELRVLGASSAGADVAAVSAGGPGAWPVGGLHIAHTPAAVHDGQQGYGSSVQLNPTVVHNVGGSLLK